MENNSQPNQEPALANGHVVSTIRNFALFVVGAVLLVIEIELRPNDTRVWVVALSLVMMGIVTVDQVVTWVRERTPPR